MITRLLFPLIVVANLFGAIGSANSAEKLDRFATAAMNRVADEFIQPRYRVLVERTRALVEVTGSLCANPSHTGVETARKQFSSVVSAWGAIEMVRFGPILASNQLERFFFYPDRRGTGLKRVKKVLKEKKEKLLKPGGLTRISVAAQGMAAIEYALYSKGWQVLESDADTYRCRYAVKVAENLNAIAENFDAGWKSDAEFVTM